MSCVLGFTTFGCDRAAADPPVRPSGTATHEAASPSTPPSAGAPSALPPIAAPSAVPIDSIDAAFAAPPSHAGRTTSIYGERTPRPEDRRQSGLVLDLPPVFKSWVSSLDPGLVAYSDTSGHADSMLAMSVVRDDKPIDASRLDSLCAPIFFRSDQWSVAHVAASPRAASVWRGTGIGLAQRRFVVYVVDAPIDAEGAAPAVRVRGCAGWAADHPELDAPIADALRSIRRGEAPPNDFFGD
ncbi:MAG: hypothetical protein U0414_02635 [Polyangiaceae bacterium]